MARRVGPLIISVSAFVLSCHADDGLATYDETVRAAQACEDGDTCVLAGGLPGCRCAVAVRADAADAVASAADEAECPDNERLACFALHNPHCLEGTCVATAVE